MNIKSASDLLGISADTIRYYERVGLVPPITRTATGIRDFKIMILKLWNLLSVFVRQVSLQIVQLTICRSTKRGMKTREERLGILEEEKQKLEERLSQLQTDLNRLNLKIKTL